MKLKVGYVLLLVAAISVSGKLASAQDANISKEDFEKVRATYKKFLSSEPHRIRYTFEIFPYLDAIEPERTQIWFVEYAPPDREHHFHGRNSSDPDAKYERIIVGGVIFTNRGGTWKRLEPPKSGYGISQGPISSEYFVRGSEKVGDHTATVYEVVQGYEFGRGNGPTQTFNYSLKYWISNDGRIRKYVSEDDGQISKRSRTTEVYEYDPKIKIEAPIK